MASASKPARLPGAAQHDSWTAFVHPDDVERCREIYRRALEKREPFQMEYRVREAERGERWILDTGIVRFSGKDFDGYVGSAVDITGLGRAHAELSNLSRHLMQAHERERAALAKTLHEDVCQRMMALTIRVHNVQGAAVTPRSPISARNWQAWSARSPRCQTRSISGSSCWA